MYNSSESKHDIPTQVQKPHKTDLLFKRHMNIKKQIILK